MRIGQNIAVVNIMPYTVNLSVIKTAMIIRKFS